MDKDVHIHRSDRGMYDVFVNGRKMHSFKCPKVAFGIKELYDNKKRETDGERNSHY